MNRDTMEVMFGHEYKLNGGQDHAIYFCPKCQHSDEGKERKLYVNLDTGGYQCKKCGYSGYVKTSRSTINVAGREVSSMDELRCDRVSEGSPGWNYLIDVRRITPSALDCFDFYDSENVTFAGGLIVPMRDEVYKGFQVRIYDRSASWRWQHLHADIRWWNCKGFSRADTIWNYGHVDRGRPVIVAESVFSGMACGRNVVATLGKDMSKAQLLRLYQLGTPLIFALDGGRTELMLSYEYAQYMWNLGRQVSIIEMPSGFDPDELRLEDPRELAHLLNHPEPYSQWRHWQLKSLCARSPLSPVATTALV